MDRSDVLPARKGQGAEIRIFETLKFDCGVAFAAAGLQESGFRKAEHAC